MKQIILLVSIIATSFALVSCASEQAPAPAPAPAPVVHHHHHHDYKGEAQ